MYRGATPRAGMHRGEIGNNLWWDTSSAAPESIWRAPMTTRPATTRSPTLPRKQGTLSSRRVAAIATSLPAPWRTTNRPGDGASRGVLVRSIEGNVEDHASSARPCRFRRIGPFAERGAVFGSGGHRLRVFILGPAPHPTWMRPERIKGYLPLDHRPFPDFYRESIPWLGPDPLLIALLKPFGPGRAPAQGRHRSGAVVIRRGAPDRAHRGFSRHARPHRALNRRRRCPEEGAPSHGGSSGVRNSGRSRLLTEGTRARGIKVTVRPRSS